MPPAASTAASELEPSPPDITQHPPASTLTTAAIRTCSNQFFTAFGVLGVGWSTPIPPPLLIWLRWKLQQWELPGPQLHHSTAKPR